MGVVAIEFQGKVENFEFNPIEEADVVRQTVCDAFSIPTSAPLNLYNSEKRLLGLTAQVAEGKYTLSLQKEDPRVNVAKWIADNITVYNGDASFLAGPTEETTATWKKCEAILKEELKRGIYDVDNKTPSGITAFPPGFLDEAVERRTIMGWQTDVPLKRAIKPNGGVRTVEGALKSYGYELDQATADIFFKYRKTHNDGVFDVYNEDMRACRRSGVLTGLPDAYGRGRIIGDYRRVALYGVDYLIDAKIKDMLEPEYMNTYTEEVIRTREEVSEQVRALKELKEMAAAYGDDISKPATTTREAIQWTYYGYLGSVREQDGAAMSFGRVDAFFDIYIEKDLAAGTITESQAQELIDQLVIKLRLCRHLRTPAYNDLFAGDPTWVTCVLGGCFLDGKSMVTKTSFRMLQTLHNLGPAPEPNLTILWDDKLPVDFKKFCAYTSIETSSIQYENDTMMRKRFGQDYAIACCVSAMRVGKEMQFFGARCNLPKLLLYILNGGKDEISGAQIGPEFESPPEGPLDFDWVFPRYDKAMDWLARVYVNTMNAIHFMHDKYCYEKIQMALHDTEVGRFLAFGIAGLSVIADSLSAIKHAKVTPIRNEAGLAVDFDVVGEFPKYGNDNDEVDMIAKDIISRFMGKLRVHQSYRNSEHSLSILTITSNVVYGKKTGSTPDGRKKGEAFAPGANPMHGRDCTGALASLNSVAKMPYWDAQDGVSNTFSIIPKSLGRETEAQKANLSSLIDGYFNQGGHHINVNVLNREMLLDAAEHPEKYPNLTIRVSGYAVHFARLTPDQRKEVISRTFHNSM